MKKNLLGSMAFVAAMGLALGACSNELENVAGEAQSVASRSVAEGLAPTVEEGFGYTEHTLWAGQHIDAGSVFVYNDYENLYVTYQTNAPWEIQEAHLFVGKKEVLLDPANGYVNKNGSPKNGKFPVNESFDPTVTNVTYTFPLSEVLGVEVPDFNSDAQAAWDWLQEFKAGEGHFCPVVAAHASLVQWGEDGEIVKQETGWGEGANFVKKGNWSMYTEGNCIEFPEPEDEDGETSTVPGFEYGNGNTAWVIDLDNYLYLDHSWGACVPYDGKAVVYNIYAGNPKNNPESHIAGTVEIAPAAEGEVTITLNIAKEESEENVGKWFLNPAKEENVKIAYSNKRITENAPGQYPVKATGKYVFTVPAANYYAIHLDMAQLQLAEEAPAAE